MRVKTPEISWHDTTPVYSCDFQPRLFGDEQVFSRLATCGRDNVIRLWRVSLTSCQPEFLASLRRHDKPVNVVRFCPNGEDTLASGGDDGVVILWKREVSSAAAAASSRALFGGDGEEEEARELWQVKRVLRLHLEDVYDLSWSSNGDCLVSGSVDQSAIEWNLKSGQQLLLKDHKAYVQGVTWDPRDEYVLSMGSDRSCRVYRVGSRNCSYNIMRHEKQRLFQDDSWKSFFRRLSYSPDGSILVCPSGCVGNESHCAYVFTRQSLPSPVLALPTESRPAVGVRFCPTPFALPSGCTPLFGLPYMWVFCLVLEDGLLFYNTVSKFPIAYVGGIHYQALNDISWSADGRLLVVCSTDGYCSLVRFDPHELGMPCEEKANIAAALAAELLEDSAKEKGESVGKTKGRTEKGGQKRKEEGKVKEKPKEEGTVKEKPKEEKEDPKKEEEKKKEEVPKEEEKKKEERKEEVPKKEEERKKEERKEEIPKKERGRSKEVSKEEEKKKEDVPKVGEKKKEEIPKEAERREEAVLKVGEKKESERRKEGKKRKEEVPRKEGEKRKEAVLKVGEKKDAERSKEEVPKEGEERKEKIPKEGEKRKEEVPKKEGERIKEVLKVGEKRKESAPRKEREKNKEEVPKVGEKRKEEKNTGRFSMGEKKADSSIKQFAKGEKSNDGDRKKIEGKEKVEMNKIKKAGEKIKTEERRAEKLESLKVLSHGAEVTDGKESVEMKESKRDEERSDGGGMTGSEEAVQIVETPSVKPQDTHGSGAAHGQCLPAKKKRRVTFVTLEAQEDVEAVATAEPESESEPDVEPPRKRRVTITTLSSQPGGPASGSPMQAMKRRVTFTTLSHSVSPEDVGDNLSNMSIPEFQLHLEDSNQERTE